MKKQIFALTTCIILTGCSEAPPAVTTTAPVTVPETTATTESVSNVQTTSNEKIDGVILATHNEIPLSIIYPTPEKMTESYLDKLSINDVYIMHSKDEYVLVIDYKFKSCLNDDPLAFYDMYTDSAFINGIAISRYYRHFDDAEAQIDTKIMARHYADVKSGFVIKSSDIGSSKECTVYVYWDKLKVYELSGKLSDLRLVEKGA